MGMVRFLPAGEFTRTRSRRARDACTSASIHPPVATAPAARRSAQAGGNELDSPPPGWPTGCTPSFRARTARRRWQSKDWCSRFWRKLPDRKKPTISLLAPHWLKQATEIVESRFLERLSLTEIASEVGVHYVHLSRQFHKYNRCTIGDMIRRRRVQYASHLLARSNTSLAEIALACGFSDQSHLSFLFKRYMGLSPSKFRSLAGLGSAANGSPELAGVSGK